MSFKAIWTIRGSSAPSGRLLRLFILMRTYVTTAPINGPFHPSSIYNTFKIEQYLIEDNKSNCNFNLIKCAD